MTIKDPQINNKAPYKALARRYRPQSFSDIIGQEVTVRTLANSISLQRIPQALLFTGTRGVGKTTMARLFAKSLNCLNNPGPSIEVCNQCSQCISIANSNSPDVLEMDAASNTSVNDIREVIENSRYAPTYSRYRGFIIDEVHMLSTSAFNALLKTLEEPPAHVVFIFATTEPHKIPRTIISRCQRFNLRPVKINELVDHYRHIIHKEGYDSEEEAIFIIAKAANGSVRDGLSILEQAMALANNNMIETQLVSNMLELNNIDLIYAIIEAILVGNTSGVLAALDNAENNGYIIRTIAYDLLAAIHRLSIHKTQNNSVYDNDLGPSSLIAALLPRVNIPFLLRAWQILIETINEIEITDQPKVCLQISLIKMIFVNTNNTIATIAHTLEEELKKSLTGDQGNMLQNNVLQNILKELNWLEIDPTPN